VWGGVKERAERESGKGRLEGAFLNCERKKEGRKEVSKKGRMEGWKDA